MPIRHIKSISEDNTGRVRTHDRMETVWLQRSSANMPWGFRMIGGTEFGLPLTVQRVTPGSVAAAALGSGDVIIKIGNVMATNLEHSDAQDLVRESGTILQLTVKKPGGPAVTDPAPSSSFGYGNQLSIQVGDYNAVPKGFGVGIPLNNSYGSNSDTSHYATTPRNFGSQRQTVQATKIEIQNVDSSQENIVYSNSRNVNEAMDNGGCNFPDYTLAYKKQELVHDSPGGPDNIRGYFNAADNTSYNTKSLPRGSRSNDIDSVGGVREQQTNEQMTPNGSYNSFSSNGSVDTKFSTGVPYSSSSHMTQQPVSSPAPQILQSVGPAPQILQFIGPSPQILQSVGPAPQTLQSIGPGPQILQSVGPTAQTLQSADNSAHPAYNSLPRPVSPQTSSGPSSPRMEMNSVTVLANKEQSLPSGYISVQTTSGNSGDHQSDIHSSGNGTYTALPNVKPTYNTNNNNNNSFSVYKSTPQPYSAPKPYAPAQASASSTFNQVPQPFTSSQFKPFSGSQPVIRKVSLDYTAEDNGTLTASTNFTARPFKPAQPVTTSNYGNTTQAQLGNQYDGSNGDNRVADFGASTQQAKSDILYTAKPYTLQGGPISPRSDLSDDSSVNQYEYAGIREGVGSLNIASATVVSVPATPPPPPPPPLAPPIWNPTPYKRPNFQPNEESEEQKVPDQLLSTVLSSAKSGGPKPFSYGIDLSELKKKIGPPTAPKPKGQQGQPEEPEAQEQYGGYRKKSVGQMQSDYYINREGDPDPTFKAPKKPAGQVQSDYLPSRQTSVDSAFKTAKKPVGQVQSDYLPSRQAGVKSDIGDVHPTFKAPKKPVGQVQTDYISSRQTGPRSEVDESPININMGTDPKKQSKSFKVLQWMTETEQDEPGEPSQKAKRNKDPERRHNADDDEMRFTGLNSKAEIPSKTFGILQRMSSHDELATIQNGKTMLDVGDAEEGNGGSEDPDLRYKGRNIPSPSFRLLQTWAELDPDPDNTPSGSVHSQSTDVAPISEF